MSVRIQDRRLPLRLAVVGSGALLLLGTAMVDVAHSHGSAVDPPSRNFHCLDAWGDDHQNPAMADEDPMCWEAWQADPSAMWNWNGLYINGVGGNHQAALPDGRLCGGNGTYSGRFDALDNVGPWHATPVDHNFTVTVLDQAAHGADYYQVYVTREGFDPVTQPLGWSDLELVAETGSFPPGGSGSWPGYDGGTDTIDVYAPGRTGQHIVFTIWKASHMDQTYYLCSDVIFPGGSEPPPTTPPPTTAPPTTPPPTGEGCEASYELVNEWGSGFIGEVTVTADSAISGWSVDLDFPSGSIDSAWNASLSGSGSSVTASNMEYNGNLSAGQSATFGFQGSGDGAAPSLSCSAS